MALDNLSLAPSVRIPLDVKIRLIIHFCKVDWGACIRDFILREEILIEY